MHFPSPALLAAETTSNSISPLPILIGFALVTLMIVSMWKVFTKADQPGWHALIPILNTWTLLKIVGRPGWWLVLFVIPFASFIVALVVVSDLAKSFGKSIGYTLGLIFLPFVFIPMLGLGDSQYHGPSAG